MMAAWWFPLALLGGLLAILVLFFLSVPWLEWAFRKYDRWVDGVTRGKR